MFLFLKKVLLFCVSYYNYYLKNKEKYSVYPFLD